MTVIGGGSNLLIADQGIRGLVIRVRGGEVRQIDPSRVRADAGVTINGLVRWTIAHGLASLEAWAGTPGTVGGAIYGNAHFQGRNISDHVDAVCLLSRDGQIEFGVRIDRIQFDHGVGRRQDVVTVRVEDPPRLR